MSITGRGEPERVEVLSVTHTTLPLLRVQPVLGRLFSKADDAPGSPLRVVLTHGYWQRKFGRATDVVGQPIGIDGAVGEIIGVLPASFRFLRANPDLLLPMQLERVSFVMFDFQALARLKPGVTLSQANADIARMIPFLGEGHEKLRLRPNVRPLSEDVTGDIGRVLWVFSEPSGWCCSSPAPTSPTSFSCARRGASRSSRCVRRSVQVRAASRGELLSEAVLLALAAGVLGFGLHSGCHRPAALDGACETAACGRDRHRPDGAAFHTRDIAVGRRAVRAGPDGEIRRRGCHRSQGRRPIDE